MKKSKWFNIRILSVLTLALFLHAVTADWSFAQNKSRVNWVEGYVSAIGHGYQKKTGVPMDVENAVIAAKIVAQSELLEAIKGVKIDRQTAVSDLIEERTETSVRVQGLLRNAFMHGEPQVKEEGVFVIASVEMRVCLHDNSPACKKIQSLTDVLPKIPRSKSKTDASCDFVPDLTSTRAILQKLSYDTTKPLSLIIINLEGQPFNSNSKDFVIGFDRDSGENCLIYSPKNVDPVVRRERGTAEIFLRVSDAVQKHGSNVLMIKAKSINQENYIAIDRQDAYLVNLINDQSGYDLFRNAKFAVAVH